MGCDGKWLKRGALFFKPMTFVGDIKEAFYALENFENAQEMQKYMPIKYLFIGIKTPKRTLVFKDLYKKYGKSEDWFEVSAELFALPEREFHYVAMAYVLKAKNSWDSRIPMLVNQWVDENSWWDMVDVLGPKVLGLYFLRFPHEKSEWISLWMNSPNFWHQRLCILFQLDYKKQTDVILLSTIILSLITSREFFIQKAIGWSLRKYARTDPAWVLNFVHNHPLSRLSKREALKH
jgi:3-methyladenine DNA glycosylase AlkD